MCVYGQNLWQLFIAHLFDKVNDNAVNTGMTTLNDIHTIPSNRLNIQPTG